MLNAELADVEVSVNRVSQASVVSAKCRTLPSNKDSDKNCEYLYVIVLYNVRISLGYDPNSEQIIRAWIRNLALKISVIVKLACLDRERSW